MVLRSCLGIATFVLFLALWIVVPPPNYPALILAVGAPEMGAWLIVVSVVLAFVAGRARGRSWLARLTVLAAVLPSAWPRCLSFAFQKLPVASMRRCAPRWAPSICVRCRPTC